MASDIFVNIDSGNGLSPDKYQAITRTNADLLIYVCILVTISPRSFLLESNCNQNSGVFIQENAFENVIGHFDLASIY